MHKTMRLIGNILLVAIPIISSTAQVHATPTSTDYTLKPPVLVQSETPLVMLGLSVDHQLFYKAYSDYADITGDGNLDTDYIDSFDYFGYFDSDWCYEYDSSDDVFEPSSSANGLSLSPKTHTCSGSDEWSGNLLNWATMTRMDVLRGVLYGGKRTSAVTVSGAGAVLERAYVPNDNHAFAKVIKTNVADFTPFTSAFSICNFSTGTANPPIFRIADGEYRRWSADESIQCRFGQANAPTLSTEGRKPDGTATSTEAEAQATVRVARCVTGKDENSTSCRQYTDSSGTTYKRPTGLLQEYGENGDLRFGLISGSNEKNISGGALRKTISLITDEIDTDDGTFNSGTGGIIETIDAVRINKWNGSKYSDCNTHSIPISTFTSPSPASNRKCSDWGNPVTEIYLEAMRYFAGETSAAFAVSSFDALGVSAAWPATKATNPLNSNNFCADCSIIMLSSGANSFDSDELGSANGIPGLSGASDVHTKTDAVATLEGITGSYVVSSIDGSSHTEDGYCGSKTVSSLSDVTGICPEVPKLEGGYNIAGLAYHAKTADMRTDSGMDTDQTISTFAVELSEALPKFSVGASSKFVDFTPACESKSGSNPWLPCSLFDVEVLEYEPEVDGDGNVTGVKKARFIFHWEDSSWGNDYDVDISQIVWVCAGSYCDDADAHSLATWDDPVSDDQVRITNGIAYLNAGNNLNVSYSVNGTTSDGLESDWMGKSGGQTTFWDGESSAGYPGIHPPESHVYSYGSSSAGSLERPLWYAAKYGGFTESSDDNDDVTDDVPDVVSEWDSTNNRTGVAGADGVPDNYFLASNPSLLRTQLQRVFDGLVARTASGTNAAVVSNSSSGVGAIYQALYQPLVRAGSSSASWVGMLQAIFIDGNGYFREDTDGDAKLDSYSEDPIITLSYDESSKQTLLQRYNYDAVNKIRGTVNGSAVDVSELKPMWSAVESLACFPNASAKTQRDFTTLTHTSNCSTGGRHILTWLETVASGTRDGEIDSGETVNFLPSEFSTNNLHRWLDVPDTASATLLIDYIRGFDDSATTGLRNRTLDKDINGDGAIDDDDVWRLGDIIHSTPAVVATPSGAYDATHSDDTYKTFFTQYQNRRQMLYVGGNDGMLHAINGGFWNPLTSEFSTEGKKHDDSDAVEHPLGSEIWAYIPQNLLPHLKWLAEPNYPHVYFVDGAPLVFDANIFNADTDHPGGWGTVMVVGMNFGGGDYPLDLDGDGIYGEVSEDTTTRSSYIIFDITNPEVAPKVLAEVQSADLGFTTSMPTFVKSRLPDVDIAAGTEDWSTPASNEWYLVFGTGPHGSEALSKGLSDQTAKVKMLNLKTLGTTGALAITDISTSDTLSSVGDFQPVDWDRDLVDDVVYFGTAAWDTTNTRHTGNLKRIKLASTLTSSTVNNFVAADHPIVAAPLTALGGDNKRWVMVGTGKLHVADDNDISDQQYFFSAFEPKENDNTYNYTDAINNPSSEFEDTTDVRIFADGTITNTSGGVVSIGGNTINSLTDMKNEIAANKKGWYVRLELDGTNPSGRVTHQATLDPANRGFMAYTEYQPPGGVCELDGESYLWELSYEAGISGQFAPLGHDTITPQNSGEIASAPKQSIGKGQASKVVFHQGTGGNLVAITNLSTGAIEGTTVATENPGYGRQSWQQIDMSNF